MTTAINIEDLREQARRRLPRVVFDYLDGGAEAEVTLRRNRSSFTDIVLTPRILKGGSVDLTLELFGETYSKPFFIGPTGLNGLYWPQGDLHLAAAAERSGVGFTVSTASNTTLEEIAGKSKGPLWFQLYPWGQGAFAEALIDRAQASGYSALVLTVDSLVGGKRERDLRHGFAHEIRIGPRTVLDGLLHPAWLSSVWLGPHRPRLENLLDFVGNSASDRELAEFTRSQRNPEFSWGDVRRIREKWKGPLLIKGIMCPEDAIDAQRAGVDGVIVSNHGGRQLDGAPATIDVLADIIAALDRKFPVLLDGGIRRGSDIVKALTLGAKGVLLGRAPLYGLAAQGEAGVSRALSILEDEMTRTMTFVGARSVSAVSGVNVETRRS